MKQSDSMELLGYLIFQIEGKNGFPDPGGPQMGYVSLIIPSCPSNSLVSPKRGAGAGVGVGMLRGRVT